MSKSQLQMIWPKRKLEDHPDVSIPPGYTLRQCRPEDKDAFFDLMASAEWPGWDDARLAPWLARLCPNGWFLIEHDATGRIVASTMSIFAEDRSAYPAYGEIGWVCVHADYRGLGLGRAVAAAATRRLLDVGQTDLFLFSEDFRLIALKIYLQMGWVPRLYADDMPSRWQTICERIGWLYTPDMWEL